MREERERREARGERREERGGGREERGKGRELRESEAPRTRGGVTCGGKS